jgi:hypothetical protein
MKLVETDHELKGAQFGLCRDGERAVNGEKR